MQLDSILPIKQEQVDRAGEGHAEDATHAEAAIPFASMLSGVLSLLASEQEGQPVEGSTEQPLDAEPGEGEEQSQAVSQAKALASTGTAEGAEHLLEHVAPGGVDGEKIDEGTTNLSRGVTSSGNLEDQATVTIEKNTAAMGSTEAEEAVLSRRLASTAMQADEAPASETAPKEGRQPVTSKENTPTPSAGVQPAKTAATAQVPASHAAIPSQHGSVSQKETLPDVSGRVVNAEEVVQKEHAGPDPIAPSDRAKATSPQARVKANIQSVSIEAHWSTETPSVPLGDLEAVASEANTKEGGRILQNLEHASIDGEPVLFEKTSEATGKTEGKTAIATLEDGEGSTDAGGDSDTNSRDTKGRSARTRADRVDRRGGEFDTASKAQAYAAEAASEQLETAPGRERVPEAGIEDLLADDGVLSEGDAIPLSEEHVITQKAEQTTSETTAGKGRAARGLFQQNRAVPVAWLRAVLNNAQQTVFSEDGWKVLEMNLDEGDGSVTIKARQEEGRMAVAVGFSDPEIRALASAHADRLQEALQAEYEGTVDLSLFSSDADSSGGQQHNDGSRSAIGGNGQVGIDTPDDQPGRRSLRAGTTYEWVG